MMREIIVGIDFSNGSLAALRLACDIANRVHADVRMIWVKKKFADEESAEKQLKKLAEEYGHKLKETKIDFVIREGKVFRAISTLALEDGADLVVVGTHGEGGFEEKFAGGNTYKTAVDSPVPVLMVRENFNFDKPLERLVMPIDSSVNTRQKVPWTIAFAKMFPHCKIHVLGIFSTKIKSIRFEVQRYVQSVEKLLKKADIPYVVDFVEKENLTIGTIEYSQKINADLIVIMSEQEKTLSNMFFFGPFAQQMINQSPVPVLVIQPVEINASVAK